MEKFIQGAIKRPGALRAKAKRKGLIKGKQMISASDIESLKTGARKTGDTRTLRQANLASTLRKLRKGG